MLISRYLLVSLGIGLPRPISSRATTWGLQQPLEKPGCNGSGLVDPEGRCNGDGLIHDPSPQDREGFKFENPSTDCQYVTQMHIWDSFKDLEKDMSKLFTLIHKNVSFTVVGHHPIAGHYNDLLHFYVNALRRVSVLFMDHADKFEIHPQAIHGGCNSRWSVQEVNFKGVMNSGKSPLSPRKTVLVLTSCRRRLRHCQRVGDALAQRPDGRDPHVHRRATHYGGATQERDLVERDDLP